MKFIAYKDTLNFSILGPPQSIRGLALYLVYKELGEEYAFLYDSEFSQIYMEHIIKNQDKRACAFCKTQNEKKIVLLSEATAVPFDKCTGKACRCYVALDMEATDDLQ